MAGSTGTRYQGSRTESKILTAVTDTVLSLQDTSVQNSEYASQKSGIKDKPASEEQPRDVHSSLGSAAQADEKKEMIVTSIRATDIAIARRRHPVKFYTLVQHSDKEWRTGNRPPSVGEDVVEWRGPIPFPSDLFATICLRVHASFEFQPMLGGGEQLRALAITVNQLIGHGANDLSFVVCREEEDIVSSCSSILVTVKRLQSKSSDLCVLDPHRSTTKSRDQLEEVMIHGRGWALSRYGRHEEKLDPEHLIEQFKRALSVCLLGHPGRTAAQSNLAMAGFIHCRVNNTDPLLVVPLTLYRSALAARPVSHLNRSATLTQLAVMYLSRFEKKQAEVDATEAEALLHEVMDLTTTGNYEIRSAVSLLEICAGRKRKPETDSQDCAARPTEEGHLTRGTQLLHRFRQSNQLADLHQAISFFEAYVGSSSVANPGYLSGLINLVEALWNRFERLGELSDLNQGILRSMEAVDITPDGCPEKPIYLNNLGFSFKVRFDRLGNPSDLEQAVSRLRDAVNLVSNDHPQRHRYLTNLATYLLVRLRRHGELSDLEQAISMYKDATQSIPDIHADKPGLQNKCGNAFLKRFELLGEHSDIEEAVRRLKNAVELTSNGHPDKPCHLHNLGNSLVARFRRFEELGDIEEAISRHRDAVNLTPDGHSHKAAHLNDLGDSLRNRFHRLGKLSDLKLAISSLREALDLTPDGHPHKPAFLDNLGLCLEACFHRFGGLSDLEEAISTQRIAVDLTSDGDPYKPRRLYNLGNSLFARFTRLGELVDIEEALSRHRNAVDLTPDGHPEKPGCLISLGASLNARFNRFGELKDLEEMISRISVANDLIPDDHPSKPRTLQNLGVCFWTRFARLGELSDLEESILKLRDSLHLIPDDDPQKPGCLAFLGNSVFARFKRLGKLADLEEAIVKFKDAVDSTPEGHPDKPIHLSSLGGILLTRFGTLGELSDLQQATSRIRKVVDLIPDGHTSRPCCLSDLGISLVTRFRHLGDLNDLEQAITSQRDAVDLIFDGHPHKPHHLSNLGTSLCIRFFRLGELSDLEQAVARLKDAVDLTPNGHPQKAVYLHLLGSFFGTRFDRLCEPSDLENAISTLREAVDLIPEDHPRRTAFLTSLADCFLARSKHIDNLGYLEQAISLYSQAACASTGLTTDRFRASQKWISRARDLCHHTLLHAYSIAISLLPQLAWIGLRLTHRYRELMRVSGIVREAAAAAMDLGHPETAVEWLEQGRSIIWNELLQLRSSYEELSVAHPNHARRLRELSAAIEHASASREKFSSPQSVQTLCMEHHATESLEQEAHRHRTLAIERDNLLKEIRGFPGFEKFLLHKDFSQLRASAHSGPVVILNAAQNRCDALIVLADKESVIHVPLPGFSFARSTGLQRMLKKFIRHARIMSRGEREGKPELYRRMSWESLLSTLWNGVVKPVLDALDITIPGDLSRIFWCPTGPFAFLPIHAAGLYGTQYSEPRNKLSDFVVSSYVPTLSILAQSPASAPTPCGVLRLLAVRQPPSDGQSPLPGVDSELRLIKEIIKNSPSTQTTHAVEPSVGTVEEVLDLLKEADWCHFACHGIQDSANPTDSGLCLADERRLRLSDIITLSRPRGGLAFLSACQTATGDGKLSDEAIHMAAGMLFAGYGGVVGTMWSISDRLAPRVARDVYQQLFRDGTTPDYRDAARALHDAIRRLRDDSKAPFVEWLPFIHVGL